MRLFALVMICASLAVSLPSAKSAAHPSFEDGAIERMKPGQSLWAPVIAPEGPVLIVVSLPAQRAYVYRNGLPIGVTTVSTGKPGHRTPTGVFTILQKRIEHRSNKYSNAPMPFMQRLTWYGVAMHAGHLPGFPASHGCIRLPSAFAKTLYGLTTLGLTVVITDSPLVPEVAPQSDILRGGSTGALEKAGSFVWQPEKSPSGPLSIVISGRDRRMVVLRNGVAIGSAPVTVDGPITQTRAYVLQSIDAQGTHWLGLPLPGQSANHTAELSAADRGRAHFPDGFRRALLAVVRPGTTLLVTRDTLRSSGTGTSLKVITVDQ